jgi:hypothetical protein
MHMRFLCCMFVAVLGICGTAHPADAVKTTATPQATATDTAAGSVKTLKGEAIIVRNGQEIPAELGSRVYAEDVLRTGKGASLGIILRDDTTVSLGPSSELGMKEFAFKPNEGLFAVALDMVKGTFVYVSGRIAKLAPDAVKVETPVGVVAVRGTKFMAKIEGK